MDFLLLLLIVILLTSGFSAFFIARKTLRVLKTNNYRWAVHVSLLSFAASFCLILFIIGYLISSNMYFGR